MERNCTNCRNSATRPEGYSEYTLEGTSFHCLERCNPSINKYGLSWESYEDHSGSPYNFAMICTEYKTGKTQSYDFGEKLPFKENNNE